MRNTAHNGAILTKAKILALTISLHHCSGDLATEAKDAETQVNVVIIDSVTLHRKPYAV